MNLYDLHSKPESLDYFEKISDNNPAIFWEKYKNKPEELKKREKYIAKSPKFAYYYAQHVLFGPFPLGEKAISKDTDFARDYARDILKKDFYLNGKLIVSV
mgnify:CR=1 FL=1